MRRIISALLFCFSSAWALAQDGTVIELAPNAPDRHIVVPGDTLWGIAARFLKDPYRWPDVWRLNPEQIKNPHRIYTGQVIILDRTGDRPVLSLGKLVRIEPRVYVSEELKEIPAIPQNAIEPFLTQPLVVEPGLLESSARIVAMQGSRINVGSGDVIYATGLKKKTLNWQIFRAGRPMRDPAKPDEILGHEAVYLGSARLAREGEPATLEVVSASQEVDRNDYLLPLERAEIVSYVPHAPATKVDGHVIALYGGVGEGGKFSIVSLSRGKRDGFEVGHVLAISRSGVDATVTVGGKREVHRLPDERYGTLFVFRVFDRVSYGLVMNASRPVVEGDAVGNP